MGVAGEGSWRNLVALRMRFVANIEPVIFAVVGAVAEELCGGGVSRVFFVFWGVL